MQVTEGKRSALAALESITHSPMESYVAPQQLRSAAEAVEPPGTATIATEAIHSMLELMAESVSALERKLQPILAEPGPERERENDVPNLAAACDLAGRLQRIHAMALSVNAGLLELHRRIDL